MLPGKRWNNNLLRELRHEFRNLQTAAGTPLAIVVRHMLDAHPQLLDEKAMEASSPDRPLKGNEADELPKVVHWAYSPISVSPAHSVQSYLRKSLPPGGGMELISSHTAARNSSDYSGAARSRAKGDLCRPFDGRSKVASS